MQRDVLPAQSEKISFHRAPSMMPTIAQFTLGHRFVALQPLERTCAANDAVAEGRYSRRYGKRRLAWRETVPTQLSAVKLVLLAQAKERAPTARRVRNLLGLWPE